MTIPKDAEGFVLVPREPTGAMNLAARNTVPLDALCEADVEDLWEAMIQAAPALGGVGEEIARIIESALWSPASGPVDWTDEKLAATKEQAAHLADAILALFPHIAGDVDGAH